MGWGLEVDKTKLVLNDKANEFFFDRSGPDLI